MKKGILTLLALFLLAGVGVYIYASTQETSTLVEQSITINKNNQEVFDYIRYFENQEKYSVWKEMDPNQKSEITGNDGQLGAVHSWESEHDQVGHGTMELTKMENGKSLEWALTFTKPFEAKSNPYMNTLSLDSNTTKVVWGCEMTIPAPFNIFLDSESKKLGNQFAQSLEKLKSNLEQ